MLTNTERFSLIPKNMQEAMEFAKIIASSDLVPRCYKNKPENVMVAVQMGLSLGVAPMQALQNIDVINGRPCLWGDIMLALVKSSPNFEDIQEIVTDEKAICTVKRKNQSPVCQEFSVKDAQKAGLISNCHKTYPRRMLQMRARGFALRDAFPDVLLGLSLAEEVTEYKNEDIESIKPISSSMDILKEKLLPVELPTDNMTENKTDSMSDTQYSESFPLNVWQKLHETIKNYQIDDALVEKWILHANVASINDLPEDKVEKILDYIEKNKEYLCK